MKGGAGPPVERFDEAIRRQGHALRVGRKPALARSLAHEIGTAIPPHSLTSRTCFRHHDGLVERSSGPLGAIQRLPRSAKAATMPRMIVFIVVIVLVVGALFFLSTLPKEQPTHSIEVAVPQGAAAGGNAQ